MKRQRRNDRRLPRPKLVLVQSSLPLRLGSGCAAHATPSCTRLCVHCNRLPCPLTSAATTQEATARADKLQAVLRVTEQALASERRQRAEAQAQLDMARKAGEAQTADNANLTHELQAEAEARAAAEERAEQAEAELMRLREPGAELDALRGQVAALKQQVVRAAAPSCGRDSRACCSAAAAPPQSALRKRAEEEAAARSRTEGRAAEAERAVEASRRRAAEASAEQEQLLGQVKAAREAKSLVQRTLLEQLSSMRGQLEAELASVRRVHAWRALARTSARSCRPGPGSPAAGCPPLRGARGHAIAGAAAAGAGECRAACAAWPR